MVRPQDDVETGGPCLADYAPASLFCSDRSLEDDEIPVAAPPSLEPGSLERAGRCRVLGVRHRSQSVYAWVTLDLRKHRLEDSRPDPTSPMGGRDADRHRPGGVADVDANLPDGPAVLHGDPEAGIGIGEARRQPDGVFRGCDGACGDAESDRVRVVAPGKEQWPIEVRG